MRTPKSIAEAKSMKVIELLDCLPDRIILEKSLKPNSKREIVQDIVIKFFQLTDEVIEEKKPKEKTPKAPPIEKKVDKLHEFAVEAKKEIKEEKPKSKTYVSHFFNFNLKAKGTNKDGKLMRYAEGHDTLDIKEQNKNNPEGVFLNLISFKGLERDVDMFSLEDFGVVRSEITVPAHEQLKQKFIESHKFYGIHFIEYDKKKRERAKVMDRESKGKLEMLVASADKTALLIPLVYIDSQNGFDTFQKKVKEDIYDLKSKAYDLIDYNYKEFLDASGSNLAKVLHLVNLARHKNIIRLTNNKREVVWDRNNQNLVTVPIGNLWNEETVDFLLRPENLHIIKKLEELTGFIVVD
jgi:hypothetical protein